MSDSVTAARLALSMKAELVATFPVKQASSSLTSKMKLSRPGGGTRFIKSVTSEYYAEEGQ